MEVEVKLRSKFNPNADKAQEALYGGKVTPYLAGGALQKTDPVKLGRQLIDLVRRGDLNGQSALAEFAAAVSTIEKHK
jgi:hypothetical protein